MGKLTVQKTCQSWGRICHRYQDFTKGSLFCDNRKQKMRNTICTSLGLMKKKQPRLSSVGLFSPPENSIVESTGILKRDISVWLRNKALLYHGGCVCVLTTRLCTQHTYAYTICTFYLPSPSNYLLTRGLKNLNTVAMLISFSSGTSFPNNCCARIKCSISKLLQYSVYLLLRKIMPFLLTGSHRLTKQVNLVLNMD